MLDPVPSPSDLAPAPRRLRVEVQVPARSIAMVLGGILIAWLIIRCAPVLLLLYLAVLLAVTLDPLVGVLQRRLAFARWLGVLTVAGAVIAGLAFILVVVVPPLSTQIGGVLTRLPELREQARTHLPASGPLREALESLLVKAPDLSAWMRPAGAWLMSTLEAVTSLVLLLSLAIYLLIDGRDVGRWLIAYVPRSKRLKVHRTLAELAPVMSAYVAGQVITSVMSSLFTYAVLQLLHVPGALALAILAGVLDVLPVLGFILSLAPAVLFALSVSGATALMVVVLYSAYHLLENYLIIPWVYGNRLKLSTLTVLLALLVGGAVAGIPGMIAVLPLFAAYPIIERIWLADRLAPNVIEQHAEAHQ